MIFVKRDSTLVGTQIKQVKHAYNMKNKFDIYNISQIQTLAWAFLPLMVFRDILGLGTTQSPESISDKLG